MRWEFSGEDQELIVSDGKQLYNYQPDLNQVIETPLAQAFRSSSFAAFMLGIGNVQRDFNASSSGDVAERWPDTCGAETEKWW